jgi:hypothetical protein
MIKNLLAIYSKSGDMGKTARLTKFIEILGGTPREEGL